MASGYTPHDPFCGFRNCNTCADMDGSDTFTSTVTGKSYDIKVRCNCNSKIVIYLITCAKCSDQYVGKTNKQKLKGRHNGHHSEWRNGKTP